ncbi:MAG: Fis family transcriptional regulator [Betaproteobacteria bacterium]|nr:Fis family transcriptional regulator [Betaproteobacteria bacterium]
MNIDNNDDIAACVRRSLERYFRDLDGESPNRIYDMVLCQVEGAMLDVVMHQVRGNQSVAAEMLGINRNTLRRKLAAHNLR